MDIKQFPQANDRSSRPSRVRLQQQPQRLVDRQQQQSSGSSEFQPRGTPSGRGQMGGRPDTQGG